MVKDILKKFNTTTNILILFLLIFGSFIWADTNGVWTLASDLRGSIFGGDEQGVTTNFTFINPVYFNDNVFMNSGLSVNGIILATNIRSVACSSGTYMTGFDFNGNIVCSTIKPYSWSTSSWSVCSCSSSQSRTVVCIDLGGITVADAQCSSTPKPTTTQTCISTPTLNSYFSCSSGSVYWYDSCNNKGSLKQSCSNGCSGNSCLAPPPPPPACSNQCSYSGEKKCSSKNVQTCGNYDADPCLEWNTGTSCTYGCSPYNGVPECVQTKLIYNCYDSTNADAFLYFSPCSVYGYTSYGTYRIATKAYPGTFPVTLCKRTTAPIYDLATPIPTMACDSLYNFFDSLGHIFKDGQLPAGSSGTMLYACWYTQAAGDIDNFIYTAGCNGQSLFGVLGYSLN